jgi:anthranilate synthase component 2
MVTILLIDNYDSFTYNLVQYLSELSARVVVLRNDEIPVEKVGELQPDGIVLSPGPSEPSKAGITVPTIEKYGDRIPILGVCLGHQAIGMAFGGKIVRAKEVRHGKVSPIRHSGEGVFEGLKNPFIATRYHSLVIEKETIPDVLKITAVSEDDGEIMGVMHKTFPVEGVQFHPESYLSEEGYTLLKNFLKKVELFKNKKEASTS